MKKSRPKTPPRRKLSSSRLSPRKSRSSEKKRREEEKIKHQFIKLLGKVSKSVFDLKEFMKTHPSFTKEWDEFLETI
jgi:hypothetical protein